MLEQGFGTSRANNLHRFFHGIAELLILNCDGNSVGRLVGWSVGRSVCHSFQKGWEVSLSFLSIEH